MNPFVFVIIFSSIICSCVQETEIILPEVSYTFIVTDSISQLPIDSVNVSIKQEDLTKTTLTTNSQGRADSEIIQSRLNQINISKEGYLSEDSVDQVTLGSDSTLILQFKSMNFTLLKISDRDSILESTLGE